LDEVIARLEHTPQKSDTSHRGLWFQDTQTGTQFMKLKPFKATVVHELQPCDPTDRVNNVSGFFSLFMMKFIT